MTVARILAVLALLSLSGCGALAIGVVSTCVSIAAQVFGVVDEAAALVRQVRGQPEACPAGGVR